MLIKKQISPPYLAGSFSAIIALDKFKKFVVGATLCGRPFLNLPLTREVASEQSDDDGGRDIKSNNSQPHIYRGFLSLSQLR